MRNINHVYHVLKRKLFDWSFLPLACWSMALVLFLKFIILTLARRSDSVYPLLKAHYMLFRSNHYDVTTSRLQRFIEKAICKKFLREKTHFNLENSEKVSKQDFCSLKEEVCLTLKEPRFAKDRFVEKGALVLKYNHSFRSFRLCVDVASVLQHHVLILEPSWSGFANFDILYFTRFTDQPIIIMAADKRDFEFIKRLETNLIPVHIGASDWVHPLIFRPLANEEKLYDAVMVARWDIIKRHHILFRTLRDMKDPFFQVALVAPLKYSNRKEIESLIDAYGIGNNVNLFEDLTPEEVNKILNQSKVNLLLSLQEGSNRSLFEGFFAGVPGVALKNNVGICKDYFTSETGKLIEEKDLGSELLYFREHWTDFDPRSWAKTNISPEITMAKLNELLKSVAIQHGEDWSRDLVAKCNCPRLKYYPDEEVGRGFPPIEEILVRRGNINRT